MTKTDEMVAMLVERSNNQGKKIDDLSAIASGLIDEISELNKTLVSMRGFAAGMAFGFSLIGGGAAIAVDVILKKMGLIP